MKEHEPKKIFFISLALFFLLIACDDVVTPKSWNTSTPQPTLSVFRPTFETATPQPTAEATELSKSGQEYADLCKEHGGVVVYDNEALNGVLCLPKEE